MTRSASIRPRRNHAWRRRLLWTVAWVTIAGGAFLALYPYPPLPVVEADAARADLQLARREASQLAPQLVNQASVSGLVMERLFAEDRARLLRFTRHEPLDRAIADTRRLAAAATAAARSVREERLAAGRTLHEELQADVMALGPDVEFLPPRERGARSALARARLAISQAAVAMEAAELDLMDRSLQQARTEVELMRKLLSGHYERYNNSDWRKRWQSWANEAVAASRNGRVAIVVSKLDRRLYLLRDGKVVATHDVDLGRNALADKVSAGDGATPEGRYRVTERRANGTTRWYKALMLNYPNADDLKNFQAMKRNGHVTHNRGPGGLIEIHGHGGRNSNWTDGCVAVPNAIMDRLFAAVPIGTPVTIVGIAKLGTAG